MTTDVTADPKALFHNRGYLEINAARQRHFGFVLDSLGIETHGLRVIELGAGIGDHSQFWIDRGCKLTITEARPENLAILRERYPDADIRAYDIDRDPVPDETFDIVYVYGLLYHLVDPARGIEAIGKLSSSLAFLETCVSFGDALDPMLVEEDKTSPTQSFHGGACRPTRPWIFAELNKAFAHVYQPGTQPDHPQFPTDWRAAPPERGLTRSTFVASRRPIHTATLFPRLLHKQVTYRAREAKRKSGLESAIAALGVTSVLDVGANLGQFGEQLRKGGFTGTITSFEPLREAFTGLSKKSGEDPAWHTLRIALGAAAAESVINVSANLFSSSLLAAEPRTIAAEPQMATIARQKVSVRRLDAIWKDLPPEARQGPILLKLDVQGYEGAVLEGAADVMASIDAVLLESSLVPIYSGELVLADALVLMRDLGFHPVWLEPGWSDPVSGQVYQCDVLFSRSSDLPRADQSLAAAGQIAR